MFLVTFASVVSSFLAYYLNFYVQSIFIDVDDFANYSLFITFIGLISIIPNTVSTSIIMTVNEFKTSEKFEELYDLFIKLLGIFFLIGSVFGLLIYKFQSTLSLVFKTDVPNFFTYSGFYLLILVLIIPIQAFIYGLMKFKSHSFLITSTVLVKLLSLGYFYSKGFGFSSIFYGFIASGIYYLVCGLLILFLNLEKNGQKISSKSAITKVFYFSVPILFISLGKELITYLDFLIVKSKFDSIISGNYALLLNIGKVFLFGSLLILGVMLPQISESFNKKENYFKKFKIYLYLELFIVGVGVVLFAVFPKLVIDLLLAISRLVGLNASSLESYYLIVDILPLYSIFISLVVLVNVFTIFLISIKKLNIFVYYILSLLLQGLLIYFASSSIQNVIFYNIICSGSLLGFLVYTTYKEYETFNHHSNL
jgi:O-antigen/teichoic acid export membrane protein